MISATLVAVVFSVSLCGCGAQLYEQRLKKTVEYFEYVDRQNQNLGKEWRGPGVSIRVPKQFERVSANDDERSRQPDYLELTLPGLVATWRCDVRADSAEGSVPCFLYLMSNQDLLDRQKTEEAAAFQQEIVRRVTTALRMKDVPSNDQWVVEDFPKTQGFVEQKQFNLITLRPNMTFFDGIAFDFSLYEYLEGDVKITFLLVAPQDIDTREMMTRRIDMCMETLDVSRSSRGAGGRSGRSGSSF